MAHHLRKATLAGLLACTAIVLGSIPIAKNTSMYQQASISAYAEETDPTLSVTDEATALTYWYVPTSKTTCTLRRITNKGDTWSLYNVPSVTIPDKIPTTNYVITEIGYANEAIIHSLDINRTVTSLTLPSTIKKINGLAMYCTELPRLTTVSLYLDSLQSCSTDAFGRSELQHINAYDSTAKKFVAIDTIDQFERYFNIYKHYDADGNTVPTMYTAMEGDLFKLKDSSLDGKFELLFSMYDTPYFCAMSYQYAQKIAAENNFTSSEFSVHTKLTMIYNYIHSHARYSGLYNSKNEDISYQRYTAFSVLSLHSGVCAGLSYAFEQLCRASGLNVTYSPFDSDVLDVYFDNSQHEANAVRLSPKDEYYIVDITDCTFMKGKCDAYAKMEGAGIIGTGEPGTIQTSLDPTTNYDILSKNEFCSGYTMVKIKSETDSGLRVEGYNSAKPKEKYFDYVAKPRTVTGKDYSCDDFCYTDDIDLYVESDCDKTFRIGGVELDPKLEQQTIQVGTNKYQVTKKILEFGPNTWPKRSAESTFINLEIKQLPTIAAQPKNVTASAGNSATFSITANGLDLTYQWQYYDTASSKWVNLTSASAKTAVLTESVTEAINGRQYRCVIKDRYGNTVTSSAAKIAAAAKITTQPQNATVDVGAAAKFTIAASGTGLTYQWQYYDTSTSKWVSLTSSDAKTTAITVTMTEALNGRKYRCVVKNSLGNSLASNTVTLSIKKYTVTLNANGGTCSTASITAIYNVAYGTLPTPTRTGYTFAGWYTAASSGTKVTADSKYTTKTASTLYAHWTANKYTVTFNANGGSCNTASQSVTYNSTYGTLPTPTKTGYTFAGWYTAASEGTKITASSKYTTAGASTLYAHWTVNYGDCNGDGVYSIADVITLQKYLTTESDTIPMPQNADMNKDNELTVLDLVLLKHKLLEL